jgi:hypothetical protein
MLTSEAELPSAITIFHLTTSRDGEPEAGVTIWTMCAFLIDLVQMCLIDDKMI